MSRLLAILSVVLLLTSLSARPSEARQVIGTGVDPAQYGIDTAREAIQKRYRYARVNPAALENSRVALNLFGGTELAATGGWSDTQLGNDVWTGSLEGDPTATVLFARSRSGLLFGKIQTDEATYIIQPKAGRIHSVVELDRDALSGEGSDDGVLPDAPPEDRGLDSLDPAYKSEAESVCLVGSTCPNQTIDVMVVYTAPARTVLGGTDEAAQTAIAAAVAEMNAANANSGVTHTFNLVHAALVNYEETANAGTDLSRLAGSTDGYIDEIHVWRDTYGADLVSMVTDTGGCGIGYVNTSATSYNPNAAFSVIDNGCMTGNRTLAHEIGHNMGLNHDWVESSSTSPCAWHHGYVNQAAFGSADTSKRWRTIMAYNTQCSQGGFNCTRVNAWSSPDNLLGGDPMGVPAGSPNPADAVFALNRAACQVSQFRDAVPLTEPPVAAFDGAPAVGAAPMNVSFDASGSGDPDGSIVSYAWNFGDGSTGSGVGVSHTFTSPGVYTVTLTVTDDGGATDTETGQVHATGSGAIQFAVIGDWGDASNPAEADVAALVDSWSPDFVITTGDNNYPLGEAATMDANVGQYYGDFIYPYTGAYGSSATTNRFFPSLGNHDWSSLSCPSGSTCTGPHFDYFELPDGPGHERYYDFVWGNVHFFALDSDTHEPDGVDDASAQAEWLQAALAASTAPWQVVYFHHAAYSSSSNHGSSAWMQWPFAAWGADAVLGGHDHTYERLSINGIPHFVNGLGGRSRYGIGEPIPGSQVLYNADYGAMLVDADATSMTFRFITRTGQLVDSFSIGNVSPPVAGFSGSPLSGDAPLTVQFSDESTGSPTSWTWDFGDGSPTSGDRNPGHEYTDPGVYTVTLTVSNAGGSDAGTRLDYVTVTAPPVPPADPSALSATAVASGGILLQWTDNSLDELGFLVERSDDGVGGWTVVADLAENTTGYTDDGLAPGSTYFYRVAAYGDGVQSGYSNEASATTPVPELVSHFASAVTATYGSISGTLAATGEVDGLTQTVVEGESSGNPRRRTTLAQVTWEVPVRAGYLATLYTNAWHEAPSEDGDAFRLSYSDNGDTFTDLGQVPTASATLAWPLGITASGTVWVRLEDTDRTPGNRSPDLVEVDLLSIETRASTAVDPPVQPTGLTAVATGAYSVLLSWTDVADESGYRIERSTAGGSFEEIALGDADVTAYTDGGLVPGTSYGYRIAAYNIGGTSPVSDPAYATTESNTGDLPVHLGGLAAQVSGKKRWKMTVTAVVHDPGHNAVDGALVTGTWTGGGTGSCSTDASGACAVNSTFPQDVLSVTFTVDDIGGAGIIYAAGSNDVGGLVSSDHPDQAPKETDAGLPEEIVLRQNYPNPFNPTTVIEFGLPSDQTVTVSVFNVLGMEIARLVDGPAEAGWHRVTFDAAGLSSGVYLAVLRVDNRTETRVMLLAK